MYSVQSADKVIYFVDFRNCVHHVYCWAGVWRIRIEPTVL